MVGLEALVVVAAALALLAEVADGLDLLSVPHLEEEEVALGIQIGAHELQGVADLIDELVLGQEGDLQLQGAQIDELLVHVEGPDLARLEAVLVLIGLELEVGSPLQAVLVG